MNSRTLIPLALIVIVAGLLILNNEGEPTLVGSTNPSLGDGSQEPTVASDRGVDNLDAPTALVQAEGASNRVLAPELEASTSTEQPEEEIEQRRFRGRVVTLSGHAVEDARVWMNRASGGFSFAAFGGRQEAEDAVQTDSKGRFELDAPKRSGSTIHVRASRFAPFSQDDLPLPEDGNLGDFVLQPGAILAGSVLSDLGQPLEGAQLRVQAQQNQGGMSIVVASDRAGPADATTDATGRFVLDELAPGPYLVSVHHAQHPNKEVKGQCDEPGYQPGELTIQLDPGGSASGLVHGWNPADKDTYEVQARPVGADFIEQVKGVRRGPITSRNSQTGEFEVTGLRLSKSYNFLVARKGNLLFAQEDSASATGRAGDHGLVLELTSRAGIEFHVVNASTGALIEEFTASAGRFQMKPLKDADGKALEHHPEGRASFAEVDSDGSHTTLEVAAVGFEPYRNERVQINPGNMQDLGTIRLRPVPILRVKVLDDATGNPVAKARVRLVDPPSPQQQGVVIRSVSIGGPQKSVRTNSEGIAELTTIPGKAMTLRVSHANYATLDLPQRTYAAEELEVRLMIGGGVRITARDSSGEPLANTRIGHRTPSGDDDSMHRTNDEGVRTYEHLSPGSHSFRIEESTGSSGFMVFSGRGDDSPGKDWTRIEVGNNMNHELELVGPPRGLLRGRLTVRGRPLANASLSLSPWTGQDDPMSRMMPFSSNPEQTDSTGAYELKDRKVGEYELTVDHPGRWMETVLRVTLSEGENEFNYDLSDTILEGRVVDTAGDGVAGAVLRPEVSRPGGGSRSMMMISASVSGSGGGSGTSIISIGGPDSRTVSDEDGSFRLHGVRPDVDLTLKVTSDGYQPVDVEIEELNPDEVRTGIEVRLEVGSTLSIRVLGPDSQPGQFGSVNLKRLSGGEDGKGDGGTRRSSFQNGSAEVQGMAPGRWSLTTTLYAIPSGPGGEMPDPAVDTREIVVVEGEPLEVEVQF
ncbi:MAG TPA: carboxypeptidase regulatory-like domain-containing protein [Planctomycetes bacterium]|nr:carboxypeptidase regulatory-like domain-containing protein [Planctomycetota bacterium]HIK62064.1 carboxypeptidase regulatory-like domain-containing protein [Planctomycetota bacterium]